MAMYGYGTLGNGMQCMRMDYVLERTLVFDDQSTLQWSVAVHMYIHAICFALIV